MSEGKKPMGTGTKILLGAVALGAGGAVCVGGSALALLVAMRGGDDGTIIGDGEYPPPGNPKGSFYVPDAGPPDTGPPIPPPANPKGSHYDQGVPTPLPPPTPTPQKP